MQNMNDKNKWQHKEAGPMFSTTPTRQQRNIQVHGHAGGALGNPNTQRNILIAVVIGLLGLVAFMFFANRNKSK